MRGSSIDFHQIREHAASKDRGFEELVYRLLPALEGVSADDVTRHGTPDGGTEATLRFLTEVFWAGRRNTCSPLVRANVGQLSESFESALDAHPSLTRYTFVLISLVEDWAEDAIGRAPKHRSLTV